MLAPHGFFSFTSVTDVTQHRAYNEWHQLDHRPENLALDGVRWGDRWVRKPDCATQSTADPRLDPTHYVNLYWFRPPVADAVQEWQGLAEQSFQWGRRQDMALCTRPLMGFFDTVKGYVRPEVRVSTEALPFRPTRGVIVQLLHLPEPHSLATERLHHWYDADAIPAVLTVDGVAGVYTFSSVTSTIDAGFSAADDARTFAPETAAEAGSLRVIVTYCDLDSLETQQRVRTAIAGAGGAGADSWVAAGAAVLFDSALRVVEPWSWDWFD
jgi:hypothetical protein